jgi:hypothetical protein
MELVVEPDIYTPNINSQGEYIDKVPLIRNGLYCLCGSRKDKKYESSQTFKSHIKTKIHQKWLVELNTNRANFFIKNVELEETVKQQRILIAQLEREVNTKSKTIDLLTERMTKTNHIADLLHFDE